MSCNILRVPYKCVEWLSAIKIQPSKIDDKSSHPRSATYCLIFLSLTSSQWLTGAVRGGRGFWGILPYCVCALSNKEILADREQYFLILPKQNTARLLMSVWHIICTYVYHRPDISPFLNGLDHVNQIFSKCQSSRLTTLTILTASGAPGTPRPTTRTTWNTWTTWSPQITLTAQNNNRQKICSKRQFDKEMNKPQWQFPKSCRQQQFAAFEKNDFLYSGFCLWSP